MSQSLDLLRIDTRQADVRRVLAELRERLSPRGNVVSEAGRQRTIEVFGEPLSPQQVVERICEDVRTRGLPAVLDYTARIDKAKLTADEIRVPAAELAAAHAAVEPEFLASVGRIRENILRFQQAILQRDVKVDLPGGGGYLRQRCIAAFARRHLRSGRRRGLSIDSADDCGAGASGGSQTIGHRRAADQIWRVQQTICSPRVTNWA